VNTHPRTVDAAYAATVDTDEFRTRLAQGLRSVPEHDREGLLRFLTVGCPVGDFLAAVIDNDLAEACKRADSTNLRALPELVGFLYNYAPVGTWGYPGAHDAMVKQFVALREAQRAAAE
jgi:hypothetical protein